MSRTKAVDVIDRQAWVWDNSHDIVLCSHGRGGSGRWLQQGPFVEDWRVWATVPDLAFWYPRPGCPNFEEMATLLAEVSERVASGGDVRPSDLQSWSVPPGELVSLGFLRTPTLPVAALSDVIEGLSGMISGPHTPRLISIRIPNYPDGST